MCPEFWRNSHFKCPKWTCKNFQEVRGDLLLEWPRKDLRLKMRSLGIFLDVCRKFWQNSQSHFLATYWLLLYSCYEMSIFWSPWKPRGWVLPQVPFFYFSFCFHKVGVNLLLVGHRNNLRLEMRSLWVFWDVCWLFWRNSNFKYPNWLVKFALLRIFE